MHCKSYSHFFSKKFQHICVSLDLNFNESLTNDVVSFEQLGPEWEMLSDHVTFDLYLDIYCIYPKYSDRQACGAWLGSALFATQILDT